MSKILTLLTANLMTFSVWTEFRFNYAPLIAHHMYYAIYTHM